MDDQAEKIKIRRSSGKIQYVTRKELEELNARKKKRDQERGWGKVSNPAQNLFATLVVVLGLAVLVLWISPG